MTEPAALDQACRLWEASLRAAHGSLAAVPLDVLAVLAYFHWYRCQVLPEGELEADLRTALDLFGALADRAAERVPDDARETLLGYLLAKGSSAFDRYQQTWQTSALDKAISAFRTAVTVTAPDHPNRAAILSNLGSFLLNRYERTGDSADLDAAIGVLRQAVDAAPLGHPYLAAMMSNLGSSWYTRFKRAGDDADLDAAIDVLRQAVDAAPLGDPSRAASTSNLAACLLARYERTGDVADLDAAIAGGQQAIDGMPPGDARRPGSLSNLGDSLLARYERDGDVADLDAAIGTVQEAVDVASPADPGRATYLSHLMGALVARYERTGDRADLAAAIGAGREAVDVASPGDPGRSGYISNLGTALFVRFREAGGRADLDAAVGAARQAADAARPGDPNLGKYLSNLGGYLATRYERGGDRADLDAAIEAGYRAVSATQPTSPERAGMLSNLGAALHMRFEGTGDRADLAAAVDVGRQAVTATPPGQPNLGLALSNLQAALGSQYALAGNRADLDDAIDAGRRAVDTTPSGSPERPGRLSNLGNSLLARYERDGDGADLDAAIGAQRQAVDATAPGNPGRATYLSNLGHSLLIRHERDGDVADLDAAIGAQRQAVDATAPGQPDRARRLSSLGAALSIRYERSGDVADLDAAIDAERQAVGATPPGHAERASYLSTFGASLSRRSRQSGDRAGLDAGIDAGYQAVDACPPGSPELGRYLSNLGTSLRLRYEQAGDDADLEAAIDAGRRAVDATPPGQPSLAMYLANLGAALHIRYERTGDGADLDAALGAWQQASRVSAGTAGMRLAAARNWGTAAADAGRIREAVDGYTAAVALLPTLAWPGVNRATVQEQLTRWGGLAVDAAACAVQDSRAERAVELLEQGRSVLWTQALNLRSDLTRLAERAPDLAGRLDDIRAILDSPEPAPELPGPDRAAGGAPLPHRSRQQQDAADLRRGKAREWEDVLAHVRALDGFEHFLTAIPYPELAAGIADGPAVIINVSRYGCAALIAEAGSGQVRVVDLPNMSRTAAIDHADALLRALASARDPARTLQQREKDRHAVLDVLDWLWDVMAEPVLGALGHTGPPGANDAWPRVWWCPTGPLTVLPLHAAGHHPRHRTDATHATDSVLSRVISSYTPTLAALSRTRQPIPPSPVRQLTVGVAESPGLPPLPAVPYELEILANHFHPGPANLQLTGPQATRGTVSAAAADHSWVHLACHASQRHDDPALSGFALSDTALTIADLASQPTKRRDLAFLSACETAAGSVRHLDEAIHLAAAMQFLGYRHVIATMWTIADSPAPRVADSIYTTLTRDGSPEPGLAARALHDAIDSLRREDPANPARWAPYIHLGP